MARTGRGIRILGLAAVAAALLPIVPTPLRSVERAPVPDFIADGTWASYLDSGAGTAGVGRTLVPVPLPDPGNAEALHWQTVAGLGFRLPGGYYNGPYGPDRVGIYGAPPRWTSDLLRNVRYTGRVPKIGSAWRARAQSDLAYWRAGLIVLAPQPNDGPLRQVVTELLGRPGRWVDGVWIWQPVGAGAPGGNRAPPAEHRAPTARRRGTAVGDRGTAVGDDALRCFDHVTCRSTEGRHRLFAVHALRR